MFTLYLVAGAVLGLCLFLMVRRTIKTQERQNGMKGRVAICPGCKLNLIETGSWQRHGLRGDFFKCKPCGRPSLWDLDREPPVFKR